jgi:hypothetical protein
VSKHFGANKLSGLFRLGYAFVSKHFGANKFSGRKNSGEKTPEQPARRCAFAPGISSRK